MLDCSLFIARACDISNTTEAHSNTAQVQSIWQVSKFYPLLPTQIPRIYPMILYMTCRKSQHLCNVSICKWNEKIADIDIHRFQIPYLHWIGQEAFLYSDKPSTLTSDPKISSQNLYESICLQRSEVPVLLHVQLNGASANFETYMQPPPK